MRYRQGRPTAAAGGVTRGFLLCRERARRLETRFHSEEVFAFVAEALKRQTIPCEMKVFSVTSDPVASVGSPVHQSTVCQVCALQIERGACVCGCADPRKWARFARTAFVRSELLARKAQFGFRTVCRAWRRACLSSFLYV